MRTAAFAIALLLGSATYAQTTTTTQPDVDVDVGVQPDGDPDIDVDVGTKTKTTTHHSDGTATTVSTSTANSDGDMPDVTTTTGTTTTGTTTTGTVTMASSMPPASGHMVAPGNNAPERDARGIPVISDPAMVPAGFNGTAGTGVGGPMVDPATGKTITGAETSHPACTATVTDNCVQTYEKGRRR